jgi:hypothetical protein
VKVREPNLKYLALENMTRLAEVPAVVDLGVTMLHLLVLQQIVEIRDPIWVNTVSGGAC